MFFTKLRKLENLSPGLKSLYLHRVIRSIGVSLVGMFGPIFIFTVSHKAEFVLIYYGLISLWYLLILPLSKYTLDKAKLTFFLSLGSLFLMLYFLVYFFMSQIVSISPLYFVVLIFLAGLMKFFYWVPYHVEFVHFIDKHHKARQLSYLTILIAIIGIFVPLFSGWVIDKFGFGVLFLMCILVLGISLLTVRFIPSTREKYTFGYFETFAKLFSKKHFKTNLAYFSDGFQDHIGFVVWPIFIFLLLKGEYLSVGLLSAVIVLVSTVLNFLVGEASDKFDKKKILRTGSMLYALGWLFKSLVATSLHVFLAGTFHNLSGILIRTPFDATTYEIAADEGHYVDEFTVLREMSLHLGKVVSTVFSLLVLTTFSLNWLFILAAGLSLLMNLICREEFYLAKR